MPTAGQFRSYRSAVGQGRVGGPDGLSDFVIEGDNYAANKAGSSALNPFYYYPRGQMARRNGWYVSDDPLGPMTRGSTSADGTAEWFQTLTNSGTNTLTSAVVGYEGAIVSTTGATSTNQNSYVGTRSHFSTTGRIAVLAGRFYFPDPVTNAFAFHFGYGNKQVAPDATQFTDGAWFEGVHSANTLTITGRTRKASGTASNSATITTIASGVPRSVELAVVMIGQTRADFFYRDPSVATNPWVKTTYSSTEMPAATVLQRPHIAMTTKAASVRVLNFMDIAYWFERPLVLP